MVLMVVALIGIVGWMAVYWFAGLFTRKPHSTPRPSSPTRAPVGQSAENRNQTLRHLDSLPSTPVLGSARIAQLWVENAFGGPIPEQMIRDMQQGGMTQNQALVMMYRNGFNPCCSAILDGLRASEEGRREERLLLSTGRGSPGGVQNMLMNIYMKAVERFLEKNYGRTVADYVLPRLLTDNPS